MAETNTMTALLSTLMEVVTQVMTIIGTICSTIVAQPLLLLTVGFLLLGKMHTAEDKWGKNGKNLEQTIPC